jgi:predicted SprT family Zn-dependent metalloprotease
MYPRLRFKIDYKQDIKTFFIFISEASFDNGRNLEWAIIKKYPYFKKYKNGNILEVSKDIVEKFVKSIYFKNQSLVEKNFLIYEKNWRRMEKDFYFLVDKLFCQYPWPKGKYIAYSTIWGLYPRFLENKTFQIPYKYKKKRYISVIIAHEMLHFIFYDYLYKKFPKFQNHKYDFYLWHLSEIFNVIIQNSPEWLKVFQQKTMIYPEHKKYLPKFEKFWQESKNIDDWIIKGYQYLENEKNLIR